MDNATTQLQFYLHSSWASSVPGRCTRIWTSAITAHGKMQDFRVTRILRLFKIYFNKVDGMFSLRLNGVFRGYILRS
jgi:hypothetical protein